MRRARGASRLLLAAGVWLAASWAYAAGPTPPPPPPAAANKPAEPLSVEERLKQVDALLAGLAKELGSLQKAVESAPRPKKVTNAVLIRACEESFSLTGLLDDLNRNWVAQGGRMRGEVSGEYTDKLLKEAQKSLLDNLPPYYQCVSRATGKAACLGMQALAPDLMQEKIVAQLKADCQKNFEDFGRNHAFPRSLIARADDAAALCKAWWLGRPQESGIAIRRETADQACALMVKNPGDAAGTCAQLAPHLRQITAETMRRQCETHAKEMADSIGRAYAKNPEGLRLCRGWLQQHAGGEVRVKDEALDQACALAIKYSYYTEPLCAQLQPLLRTPAPGKPCQDFVTELLTYLTPHVVSSPEAAEGCRALFAAKRKSGEFDASPGTVEQACRAMVGMKSGEPGAACAQLTPLFQQTFRENAAARCEETLRYLNGDASVCASIREKEVGQNCKAYAAFRKARKAGDPELCGASAIPSDICRQMMGSEPKSCEAHLGKIRTWYCGRYQKPEFAKASADLRRQYDDKFLALSADKEKELRARFGVISGLLFEATSKLDGIQPHESGEWRERHALIDKHYAKKDRLFKRIGKPAQAQEEGGEE